MRFGFPRRHTWLTAALAAIGAFALVAAACGDDDDGGGDGSDESYVRGLCSAVSSMQSDAEEAFEDFDPQSVDEIEDALETLQDVFGDFVNDLEDLNPPADVSEYHDQVVEAFQAQEELLEEGTLDALSEFGDFDVPSPPQAVQDRLSAVAENTSECDDLGGGGFFES